MTELLLQGCTGESEATVAEGWTATAMGSGAVPVLATPALVALMEQAAVRALEGGLPPSQTSVGIHMDVSHLAATPVGMGVHARATVVAMEGRRITFHIEAWDEVEKIGEATHERVLVDVARFTERAGGKRPL